jgi:adenylate cyclase
MPERSSRLRQADRSARRPAIHDNDEVESGSGGEAGVVRGATHRLSLRFLDDELERQYQLRAGAESLSGYRLIALASALIWAPAAFILPLSTSLPSVGAIVVGLAMSGLSFVFLLLSRWATKLDRQHLLAGLLTSTNATVVLGLATIGGALPGYGVAAMALLFTWGYVSRTRFVYAALRTALIAVAFWIVVATYKGPADLTLDVLFFAASAIGVLLALHIAERTRRRLFSQDVVVREQADQLAAEIHKSDALIHNVLPEPIADRLLAGETTIAVDYPAVTVLFADIVGFTPMSAQLRAREVIDLLGRLFVDFDGLAARCGVQKIKTIGDAYMAVGGLSPGDAGPEGDAIGVVRMGLAMIDEVARHEVLGRALQLRIGVHSGPAVGGVIGTQRLAFDLWGDTVNVASRLQELAPPGRVLVSERTMLLVRGAYVCEPVGESDLRGHSSMKTFVVVGPVAGPG